MKFLVSAGVVVFRITNKVREYLLLYHVNGHWDFPKGKMEKGESKRDTALRELKEEADISVHLIDNFQEELSYIFRDQGELTKKTVYFFLGKAENRDVAISHEHEGFEWLPYAQALERLTFKNAQDVLVKAEQFLSQ
jgi:bis(5'-nucleosidyl)-tetraphosphatase